jgi:hypothetical protein
MVAKTNKTDKPVKTDKPELVAKTAKIAKPEPTIKPVKASKTVQPELVTKKPIEIATASKTVKADKLDMTKLKRLPKGERANQRRLKQIARQEGTTYHSLIARHPFIPKAGGVPPVPVED